MKVITTQQMNELEVRAAKEYSITQKALMENAGIGIAKWLETFVKEKEMPREILVISGRGNNGGDSFVAARLLVELGFKIDLILLSKETDLKGAAKSNYLKLKKKRKVSVSKVTTPAQLEKIKFKFDNYNLILDGILGTGVRGEVKGLIKKTIEVINGLSKTIISIDIPSGMDGNSSGGYSINAYATLTMGMPKVGIINPEVEDKVGYIHIIDIGFPQELVKSIKSSIEYIYPADFSGLIRKRAVSSHKGNFGHVLVLAGSPNYTGAAALCTLGALRSGAGLVTLGMPRSLHGIYQQKFLEAMTLPLAETEDCTLSQEAFPAIAKFMDQVDCIALGPGLSRHPDTIQLVKKIISSSHKPLVIDADGVNAIAEELLVLRKAKAPLVLTPHPGEMARLLHTSSKGIQRDKWKIVRELSDKYGITILLKGAHSVIAGDDKKIYINSTGNPGMASGGMGDVLTGIIASFIGQGIKPLNAARLGAYLHGAAGDVAAKKKGEVGLIAGDLIEELPYIMDSIYGK